MVQSALALLAGNISVGNLCREMGSSIDTLHSAAFRGDSEAVKKLLRKHDVSVRGEQGQATPLHAAGAVPSHCEFDQAKFCSSFAIFTTAQPLHISGILARVGCLI